MSLDKKVLSHLADEDVPISVGGEQLPEKAAHESLAVEKTVEKQLKDKKK